MGSFDLNTFLALKGGDQRGFVDAFGMAYGIPQCVLSLGLDTLRLLPKSIVSRVLSMSNESTSNAEDAIRSVFVDFFSKTGIIDIDTVGGIITWISQFNHNKLDTNQSQQINDFSSFIDAIDDSISTGSELYNNFENIQDDLERIKDCLASVGDVTEFSRGYSSQAKADLAKSDPNAFNAINTAEYADAENQIASAKSFIDQSILLSTNCGTVIAERKADPSLEPVFNPNLTLSGTTFEVVDPTQDIDSSSVFRLTFGPPKSKEGQFLLTIDGLYFDAQTGGLSPAYLEISSFSPSPELSYLFEHEPAAGGKGVQFTKGDIDGAVNVLFDENHIDESLDLQTYYDADHFLQVLIGQKNKEIYDLSGQVQTLEGTGGVETAIVQNMKEAMRTTLLNHNSKITRRKKQIEVAVRMTQMFDPRGVKVKFELGTIPINDFSYLGDLNINIPLEVQKKFVFKASEVRGIIKPIIPKFVKSVDPVEDKYKLFNLVVPPVGKGGIIYSTSSTASSVEPMILSLTDQISVNGLVAVYNFLDFNVVDPSSTKYTILNCAGGLIDTSVYNNAKLIAKDSSSVFVSGLGIPKFTGIVEFGTSGGAPGPPNSYTSSLGSVAILPDTPEFRNLTYGKGGWSMDFWSHIPSINTSLGWGAGSSDTSSISRLVLACENTGSTETSSVNPGRVTKNFGSNVVRGLVAGFTRDRRITQNLDFKKDSDINGANDVEELHFYVAPTQSYNLSTTVYINNVTCASGPGWYNFKVKHNTLPAGGTSSLGDVSAGFIHFSITCDPKSDKISLYVDGLLAGTSSLSLCFGTNKYSPINIPSFAQNDSFYYGTSALVGSGLPAYVNQLNGGPKLNNGANYKFTPWVVGGGYTDGVGILYGPEEAYFMGPNGGMSSGLNGFLGSMKFYSRSLTASEALSNFKAQKGFFKNIII